MAFNIVTADFNKRSRDTRTPQLFQWDYGQILHIVGLNLPPAFEVHFSNEPIVGEAETHMTDGEYIEIPYKFLEPGNTVYAFIFLHETDSDGETKYTITIPVRKRPKPIQVEPTPTEKSIIDEAIVALNNAITKTNENVEQSKEYSEDSERYAQQSLEHSQNSAESARQAKQSEDNAKSSETNSKAYAERAEFAKTKSEEFASNAYQSELNAEDAATRAEQSAAVSGYMFFDIGEDGHLYLDKTRNVDVDFYLSTIDGHLYVTE